MAYLPYGQERGTPTTPDNREKFGTYWRDQTLGADYADQRYYAFQPTGNWPAGRFLSPDPGGMRTADASNPQSWNRYSYVYGDPINMFDPTGTYPCGAIWADDGQGGISVTTFDCSDRVGGGEGGHDGPLPEAPIGDQGPVAGGGGAGGGVFNPLSIAGFLQASAMAISALSTNPDCSGLLGIAPNSMNPATLLSGAISSAVNGSVTGLGFGTTTNGDIVAQAAEVGSYIVTDDPWAYTNANGQHVESTRVLIQINLTNWANLTPTQQAQDIIHELGHVFDELLGAGGSQFVNDALPNGKPDPVGEATNAALVQKCIHN